VHPSCLTPRPSHARDGIPPPFLHPALQPARRMPGRCSPNHVCGLPLCSRPMMKLIYITQRGRVISMVVYGIASEYFYAWNRCRYKSEPVDWDSVLAPRTNPPGKVAALATPPKQGNFHSVSGSGTNKSQILATKQSARYRSGDNAPGGVAFDGGNFFPYDREEQIFAVKNEPVSGTYPWPATSKTAAGRAWPIYSIEAKSRRLTMSTQLPR